MPLLQQTGHQAFVHAEIAQFQNNSKLQNDRGSL